MAAKRQGEGVWQPAADPFAAVCGADGVVLLTAWKQFRQFDWPALAAGLRVWVVREGADTRLTPPDPTIPTPLTARRLHFE